MRYSFAAFFAVTLCTSSLAAQPRGTQPGTLADPLAPADTCTECHAGGTTSTGERYMAADSWRASMMANAARDPLFLATLTAAEQDSAGVGTLCLRCHTPTGFTGGRATPGLGTRLDPLSGDLDGVHCDTCHRSIIPTGVMGAPFIGNAQLYFSDNSGGIATRFGPREDPVMSPRHPAMGSAFIRDARQCGQCHDIDHPVNHRLTATGTDTGAPFPLQSTYTEWSQSDYARRTTPQTCVMCHMTEVTGEMLPATRIPGSPNRPGLRRHDLLGANEWGMAMLRAAYPGERDAEYDAMRMRIRQYLRTSARVELMGAPTTGAAGSMVPLRVRVTNLSGHKLPTGYEDARLMWLQVQVGETVVSGAFTNDELVEDAQARVYRFQAGRIEGGRVVPSDFVVRHQVVIEDTRIPPLGMRADARTAPVGRDYAGGADGTLRNYDDATFNVALPATAGATTVTVRLMYRTTTKHYVETIAGANRTDNRGRDLLAAWNASGRATPFSVAEATTMVMVTGGSDAGVSDGGLGDGGASDAATDAALDASARDAAVAPPPSDSGGCSTHPGHGGVQGIALSLTALAMFAARRRRR